MKKRRNTDERGENGRLFTTGSMSSPRDRDKLCAQLQSSTLQLASRRKRKPRMRKRKKEEKEEGEKK